MGYTWDNIRLAQEIFYYLLEHHELRSDREPALYEAYMENAEVQKIVKSQGDASCASIDNYGTTIYFIPKEENEFLGYSKAQLKRELCRSGATDRDYYLSQFVVITLLTEFYDGTGSSSLTREFMKLGEFENILSKNLRAGVKENVEEENEGGIAFSSMLQAYEALRSEKGSRAKTTKEGFLFKVLSFLQDQGLIEYVEADEMITTTKKLDSFMDWNLLNEKNFERVRRVLEENHEQN